MQFLKDRIFGGFHIYDKRTLRRLFGILPVDLPPPFFIYQRFTNINHHVIQYTYSQVTKYLFITLCRAYVSLGFTSKITMHVKCKKSILMFKRVK